MNEKDNFYHVVLQKASAIRERVNGLESTELNDAIRNATITQCLTNVNDLKHEIGSRANQIAPHDQRIYNELLNGLNQQLQEVRSQFAPKRKFAFKPKASANLLKRPSDKPASPPIKRTSTPEVEKASENLDPEPVVAGVDPGDLQKASVLKDINHELRTESNFGHVDRGILMSNSSQCIIRCALPSPKLTINNIQTSVLVAGPINGAAFVTGMSASVLIVVCRQLRMHRCRNCVVYLRCSSKPIIEDCLSIQFAPFPDEMVQKRFSWLFLV